MSQLLIPALFTLYRPIYQASCHQIPAQLYPFHFLANTYFGTPLSSQQWWRRGDTLVILGRKALDGESNSDGVVHEAILTSPPLHSPSNYHCSTPLPSQYPRSLLVRLSSWPNIGRHIHSQPWCCYVKFRVHTARHLSCLANRDGCYLSLDSASAFATSLCTHWLPHLSLVSPAP